MTESEAHRIIGELYVQLEIERARVEELETACGDEMRLRYDAEAQVREWQRTVEGIHLEHGKAMNARMRTVARQREENRTQAMIIRGLERDIEGLSTRLEDEYEAHMDECDPHGIERITVPEVW
jgi:chromosome segregation ATPase